jgi:hypothetical protein
MHDLQLVGFTTDRRGLIFRTRAGSRPEASFVVPITDELVELVTQLADDETRPTGDGDAVDGSDEPAEVPVPATEPDLRPRSQLSVRDIQARLRAGEPTSRIAAEAGVEVDWIERFAPPVRAEQQRIVAQALECHLHRARSAPSAVPLRRAVGMALADKGIAYTVAAYEAAWSARLLGHDRWAVSFTYHHRGRERVATWTYDAGEGTLTTGDRVAAQLGYVAPGRPGADEEAIVDGIVGDPAATAANTTTPEAPAKTAATRRTATKRPPAKKAAATKATPKKPPAKKAASKKPAAKKPAAKKAATKKAASKKPATKTSTPETRPAKEKVVVKTTGSKRPEAAPAERTPPPPVTGDVDVPGDRRLPDQPPRPAEVPVAVPPLADRPPEPAPNGRPHRDPAPPPGGPGAEPAADEVDPASARRERAAQRTASTVHFRSGSAAPVRVARDPRPPSTSDDRPVADDRPRPDPGERNGAARPATRRRRQLRAR